MRAPPKLWIRAKPRETASIENREELNGFKVLELQNHGRNTNDMKRDAQAKSSQPRRKAQRRASAARRGVARARSAQCVMLGEHIVVDPLVCHGRLTYKGTRIMVWQILDELEHGMSPDEIVKAWGGRVSKAAISESIRLARGALLDARGRLARPINGRVAA